VPAQVEAASVAVVTSRGNGSDGVADTYIYTTTAVRVPFASRGSSCSVRCAGVCVPPS